jgi:hypothetical protein
MLFFSEKVCCENIFIQNATTTIYEDFKCRAGYSKQEIQRKKEALKDFLIPLTEQQLLAMLRISGFECLEVVVKWNNFTTIVAIKKNLSDVNLNDPTVVKETCILQASSKSSSSKSLFQILPSSPSLTPRIDLFFHHSPDYLYRLMSQSQAEEFNQTRISIYNKKKKRFQELNEIAEKLHTVLSTLNTTLPQPLQSFNTSVVHIGTSSTLNIENGILMSEILKGLIPWRKGPFNVFGTEIDSEWRSDWKWDRLRPFMGSLRGKTVADIG